MPRKPLILGVLTALLVSPLAVVAPAAAVNPPADNDRYVDVAAGEEPGPEQPNEVATGNRGERIEIYGSIGDSEGGMDWRTINAFSHLVGSVPQGKASYTTLFNSLYDGRNISYDSATDTFKVAQPNEVFAPVAAYLKQVNQYADPANKSASAAARLKNINVIGAKRSMGEAFANKSSLALLAKETSPRSMNYKECRLADGACLSEDPNGNIMHSKYGAFEEARDSQGNLRQNVVWITSSNLNGSSGSKKTNLSVAIYGDKESYDFVVNEIYRSQANAADNRTFGEKAMTDGYKAAITAPEGGEIPGFTSPSGMTLYPSPRAFWKVSGNEIRTARADVEANFIKGEAAKAINPNTCKVYSIHSLFNSTRNGVREGLAGLANKGCDVRIVLGTNAISDIVDGYFTMSTELRDVIDRVEFANVHDKSMSVINGATNVTFGGSSNFSGTSLDYDELAFKLDNLKATQGAQEHSERVYQRAKSGTKWATTSSVSVAPSTSSSKPLTINPNGTVQISPRTSPSNALVTKTSYQVLSGPVSVSANGWVKAAPLSSGPAQVEVSVTGPGPSGPDVTKKSIAYFDVKAGKQSEGAKDLVTVAPTLSMDRYQSPTGLTHITATWGNGEHDYQGVVKLQYYSSGSWKTYGTSITTNKNGAGHIAVNMKGSKTWRAYGAAMSGVYKQGQPVDVQGITTAKTKSAWSINTVRTKTASTTPRLYATSMNKKGAVTPLLVAWDRSGGTFRLQYKAGSRWTTHKTYKIPSGSSQILLGEKFLGTKTWRIATSTGTTKTSNSVRIAMK